MTHSLPPPGRRWDLFCKVIDNFGDAGVAWRLARQLAAEHGLHVRLIIDRVDALARIAPEVDPTRVVQQPRGVEVRTWNGCDDATPPDAVVELFGCGLPEAYAAALAAATPSPPWFVLEYLSAETWIESAHDRPSPHPRLGITRRFWFPGFGTAGGLLREAGLMARRDTFRGDASAQAALWRTLGVAAAPDALRVSVFCYDDAPLAPLLDAWAGGDRTVAAVVPEGVACDALHRWVQGSPLRPGIPLTRGRLRLHAVPFVSQDRYDELLWSCDVNLVRGEDSFVRAQWSGAPLVWNIYRQAERAHHPKLEAFVATYAQDLDQDAAAAFAGLLGAWNRLPDALDVATAWPSFALALPRLRLHAWAWAQRLAGVPDLASGLVRAAQSEV